jgi:predicted metalloprotease
MRWGDFRRSDNVEESSGGGGGGFGGMRLGGGAVVVVVVVSLLLGKNPLEILALLGDGGAPTVQTQPQTTMPTSPTGPPTVRDKQKDFVAAVLGDTEDVWGDVFQKAGSRYQRRNWCFFAIVSRLPAVWRARHRGRSIAPAIRTFTSTSRSSTSCRNGSARPVILRART